MKIILTRCVIMKTKRIVHNIDHNDNLQMVPVLVLDLDRVKRLQERRLLSLLISSPLSPSASRGKINCHSG